MHCRLVLIFLQAALNGWATLLFLALAIACGTLGYPVEAGFFGLAAGVALALGFWRWRFIRRHELVLTRIAALILYPLLLVLFTCGTFAIGELFREITLERNRLHLLIYVFGWIPNLPLLIFLAEYKALPDEEPVPGRIL
jgi:hypothetical protein